MRIGLPMAGGLVFLVAWAGAAQVIEFESGGLIYQTQTRDRITVMFASMPIQVREFAVMQVGIANGSEGEWMVRPEDFRFQRPDGTYIRATTARDVVAEFIERGGRNDVIKLVTAYEQGLYGLNRVQRSTNGYQQRREMALAAVGSAGLKAGATASAIALVPVKLLPGQSTDGAVFYANAGRPLGSGKLILEANNTVFEFEILAPAVIH